MDRFVSAIRGAIDQRNWYAALALSLTMPDICGRLESPNQRSQKRYVQWCDKYLTPRYTSPVGPASVPHIFLNGDDCYALRCAVLHEGSDEIVTQQARKALESFFFVAPIDGIVIHNNQVGSRLQLQVDIFANDICAGVDRWIIDVSADHDIAERIAALMQIHIPESGRLAF